MIMANKEKNIIVIGSSTGGPKLLVKLFSELPPLNASIIIVQHVPPVFDRSIAERLDRLSAMDVALAQVGDVLEDGKVYFAPAKIHLKVQHNKRITLVEDELVNCCCPSIDVAMKSIRANKLGKIVGVVLTGMGRDGADGISHIKSIGGITIAQDEASSVIYGMPKAAYETGKVDFVLHEDDICTKLVEIISINMNCTQNKPVYFPKNMSSKNADL